MTTCDELVFIFPFLFITCVFKVEISSVFKVRFNTSQHTSFLENIYYFHLSAILLIDLFIII